MKENYWISKLRNTKNWDFAMVVFKSSNPLQLPREAKYIVEPDPEFTDVKYMVIQTETPVSLPPEPGKPRMDLIVTSTIVDLSEITRIDFVHKVQPIGPEGQKKPGIIMP